MYSNFNVTELNTIRTKSDDVFSAILTDIKGIQEECAKMGEIVLSDDSNLGARWNSVSDNIGKPIETINDTFTIVKALLNSYVESTIENEKAAQAELEQIDGNITTLSNRANVLLDGLTTLKGIGIGSGALAIEGVAGWNEGEEPITYKGEHSTGGGAQSTEQFVVNQRDNGPKVVRKEVQELAEAFSQIDTKPIDAKLEMSSSQIDKTALKNALNNYESSAPINAEIEMNGPQVYDFVSGSLAKAQNEPTVAQAEISTNSGSDPFISMEGISPMKAVGEYHETTPDLKPIDGVAPMEAVGEYHESYSDLKPFVRVD